MRDLTRRDFGKLASAAAWAAARPSPASCTGSGRRRATAGEVTLLYTNDFHSAFDPMPAFWLPGARRLGGASHLATLVERERAATGTSFLLDSGDMFTGTLSRLTEGEALLELMLLMRYDAMGVGNHEFDYGWQSFERGMQRVPFPILCCNVRHRTSGVRFARPHTILERDGVRLGVIGVIGMKAATRTIMPSKVAELEFTDPVLETRASVRALRDQVDVIVVLGHMGLPGPMQSDAEADPSVQRSLDEDLAFVGAVPGIDVYIAAHSHHGLETPLVHADTGTIITQTYGYGTRLGRIRLALEEGRVVRHDVSLLKVWSDELVPHPAITARIARYRAKVADQIGPPVGRAAQRFIRKYHAESSLGSFCADVMRERAGSEVGITNAGGLRADLAEGPLDKGDVLNALPFLNDSVTLEVTGGALRAVLEQGCSLEAGMVQVSGVRMTWDRTRPAGARVLDVQVHGAPLELERRYRVTTNSFLAEGGDGYAGFVGSRVLARDLVLSDLVLDHIRRAGTITPPPGGRIVARYGLLASSTRLRASQVCPFTIQSAAGSPLR
ncbi:MAG: bifunctional metallophosphatase/5'-nucleotidase [Gemmatimonadetes bacterium]|nr:bifunctional metallophosphatase/5'-nucleotidase [Gemmatimonadota bacterium]